MLFRSLFAKSGANVVISARRQAALDEVASKIKAEGGNAVSYTHLFEIDILLKFTQSLKAPCEIAFVPLGL